MMTDHSQPGIEMGEDDQPCARCASINPKQMISSTGEKKEMGSTEQWSPESCKLCKFLIDLLPPELASQTSLSYFLYAKKSEESTEKLVHKLANRLLVLSTCNHGPPPKDIPYIAVHSTEETSWVKRIEPLVDFVQMKEWLNVCDQLHASHCSVEDPGSNVENMHLIDCTTGKVNKAGKHEVYVALSYVWGQQGGSKMASGEYPQTIQDAIIATRQLGYSRLWVDQYCIDQKNPHEFQEQLQQMDLIYKQAAVTLVAAAGTNADHGLPGVSRRMRMPMRSVRIGEQSLTPILSTPDLSPENCRWASRAWTFQEGLMSTRRLVFTEDQAYYECRGMYCPEMLNIPMHSWKLMHHRENPWLHSRYRLLPALGIFPLAGCGVDSWEIYSRISEYSKRQLTHPSDILNGMLGIFRTFEKNKNPIRHLYGLAFPAMAQASPNDPLADANAAPIFSESLRWNLPTPGTRRQGFPSWSWTGWYGEVGWPAGFFSATSKHRKQQLDRPRNPRINLDAMKVGVELRDGTVLDWKSFQARYHELLTFGLLSGIIHVEANTMPVQHVRFAGQATLQVLLQCTNGSPISLEVDRTASDEIRPQDALLAIQICCTHHKDAKTGTKTGGRKQHILIVKNMGSHWERVASGAYERDSEIEMQCTWRCLRLG